MILFTHTSDARTHMDVGYAPPTLLTPRGGLLDSNGLARSLEDYVTGQIRGTKETGYRLPPRSQAAGGRVPSRCGIRME
jgi:hypothetical protein